MSGMDDKIAALCEKEQWERADLELLQKSLAHCGGETRRSVAERLGGAAPQDAWPMLRLLTYDEDPLVRAEACHPWARPGTGRPWHC